MFYRRNFALFTTALVVLKHTHTQPFNGPLSRTTRRKIHPLTPLLVVWKKTTKNDKKIDTKIYTSQRDTEEAHVVNETLKELVESGVCNQLCRKCRIHLHAVVRAGGLRSRRRPSCTTRLHTNNDALA